MTNSLKHQPSMQAPRYTSYPPAHHFDCSVTVDDYAAKLDQIHLYEPLSLYVHIPFCRQLCWYCSCNMRVEHYYARARAYVDALIQEIKTMGQALNGRGRPTRVQFGGGTPNYLLCEDLSRILEAIECEIGLTDNADLAIELDPRILRDDDVDHLTSIGFRQFILGVQDFDPIVQNAMNRIQGFDLIAACVREIRAAGVDDLSFDILYGLPKQSERGFSDTIDKVTSLSPDCVSVIGYAHAPNTLTRQKMIDPSALPNEQQRMALAALADQKLVDAGYVRVGFDHYAKADNALARAARDGRLKRSFQGFADDAASTLIGFGASAISFVDGLFVENEKAIGEYMRMAQSGAAPIAGGLQRTKRESIIAAAIGDLLCRMETNISAVLRSATPADAIDLCASLERLESDRIIQWRGDTISVCQDAHGRARTVAMAIDPYSGSQTAPAAAL